MTDVSVREFALDLAAPLGTADGEIDRREGLLVRVTAEGDAGETTAGVGEATPLPGWTESIADCRAALTDAADRLPGSRLARGGAGATPGVDALDGVGRDDTPAARHGLALALADCRARHEGQPLWSHLGETAVRDRPAVRVNATVGDGSVEKTRERTREAVRAGFDCLKMKVGARDVETDLERLAAVRDVTDGATLRADANAAWDRPTAERFLDGVAGRGVDLAYVEQPLPAADLAGHAALREREQRRDDDGPGPSGTGVALDESLTENDAAAVLDAGAADAVVLKPMALGGPDRAVAVARHALKTGTTPVVTTTVDAVVARTAAVHVAAAVDSEMRPTRDGTAPTAHGLATADRLAADLAVDPAPVESGRIRVPTGPGTGVGPEVFES